MITSASPRATTIAIIGAGFCGTMTAVHLLRDATPDAPVSVTLLDRTGTWGRGIAYSASDAPMLLNVPARAMSAFPDAPGHFLAWLTRREPDAAPSTFARRSTYGDYLVSLLGDAARDAATRRAGTLQRVAAEAVDIQPSPTGAIVGLSAGGRIEADRVVLAVGNFPPSDPPLADRWFYRDPRYVGSPWATAALTGLASDVPLLLLGTGLTMFDIVATLADRGHDAPIHVLSRRGLIPHVHREPAIPCATPPPKVDVDDAGGVVGLMRRARAAAQAAEAGGCDWRQVLDGLRPHLQSLWRSLPSDERRRFLRHARPYWEIHRHRLPPEVLDVFDAARRSGRVELHAGAVRGFAEPDGPASGMVDVTVGLRGGRGVRTIRVGRVINCTGPTSEYRKLEHPLIRGLLAAGRASPDPLHLGLDTDEDGALLDAAGQPSPALFGIGPVRKGALWETTAVPELREQARELARRLVQPRPAAVAGTLASADGDRALVGEVRLELTRRSRGTGS